MNTYTLSTKEIQELNKASLNDLIRAACGKTLLTNYKVK